MSQPFVINKKGIFSYTLFFYLSLTRCLFTFINPNRLYGKELPLILRV